MQHLQLAFVNERLLAEDQAKREELRNLYRNLAPAVEGWRSILHQAADILDHLGWCRTTVERGRQHCAIGAIIAAYNQGDVPNDYVVNAFIAADPALRAIIGRVEARLRTEDVMDWNDMRAKSGKQVAALLRQTAVG
jgi:hypothetical protein